MMEVSVNLTRGLNSHRVQSDDEIIALWGDSFELHAAGL